MNTIPNSPIVPGRWQARSVVASCDGIVATENPLAAQAGAAILAAGGHAVDAAIAANAVMTVVAPHSCGVGGDLFALIYEAQSGAIVGLNASGWSPADLTVESLVRKGATTMPAAGVHSITVPGAVDGWEKLRSRFGRLSREALMAPAIHYAEIGFPVTEWSAERWHSGQAVLTADAEASRVFLPNGRAPRFGEVFKNPDLAETLRAIGAGGREAFYGGEIARRIVQLSSKHGGLMTLADLAEFSSEWVEPISTTYRGWTVYELPPNGAGIAALVMLNMMENYALGQMGHNSSDALHLLIESKKLAYADLLSYVGDPRSSRMPLSELLSKEYAKRRCALIEMKKANCQVAPGKFDTAGDDTIYLSVVDRSGNLVSLIQSNFAFFGSGLVPERKGFVLQNRGSLFTLDPSHPNVLAGRKRPLHTILPALMHKENIRIAFGIQGGWNQSQAHAQFVSNIVDHGMNIQAALEAPRFTKLSFDGCDVQMEARISSEIRAELTGRGHQIENVGGFSDAMGGGQAAMRDYSTGVNYGASDPRKDGAAIPEAPRLRTPT